MHLSQLLDQVEAGEMVVITRHGETEAWFLSVLPARERQALDRAPSRLLARSRERATE